MGLATRSAIAAATAAVTNRFVASTNMINGAYVVANASPAWAGACNVVATITANTGNDTPGVLTIVGTDLAGQPRTEVLPLVAGGTATGVVPFRTITSITGAGWVINGGNDTIVVGHAAGMICSGSSGTLFGTIVQVTAASTVVLADAAGTILTQPASYPVGEHPLPGPGIDFAGFLKVTTTGANDIVIVHTPHAAGA